MPPHNVKSQRTPKMLEDQASIHRCSASSLAPVPLFAPANPAPSAWSVCAEKASASLSASASLAAKTSPLRDRAQKATLVLSRQSFASFLTWEDSIYKYEHPLSHGQDFKPLSISHHGVCNVGSACTSMMKMPHRMGKK